MTEITERHRMHYRQGLIDIEESGYADLCPYCKRERDSTSSARNGHESNCPSEMAAKCLDSAKLAALESDQPQDKSYCPTCDVDVPPEDEVSGGTHRKCGEPIEYTPDPPQTSDYVQTEDDIKQSEGTLTVGSHDNTPPEGLEAAVREAIGEVKDAPNIHIRTVDRYVTVMVAAVQPFCWKPDDSLEAAHDDLLNDNHRLQAEVQEHQNHVAGLQSFSHAEYRCHIKARRELHIENAKLKKQIEHQREIHESNEAAFDTINNEAHEKIEKLQECNDRQAGIIIQTEDRVIQLQADLKKRDDELERMDEANTKLHLRTAKLERKLEDKNIPF